MHTQVVRCLSSVVLILSGTQYFESDIWFSEQMFVLQM